MEPPDPLLRELILFCDSLVSDGAPDPKELKVNKASVTQILKDIACDYCRQWASTANKNLHEEESRPPSRDENTDTPTAKATATFYDLDLKALEENLNSSVETLLQNTVAADKVVQASLRMLTRVASAVPAVDTSAADGADADVVVEVDGASLAGDRDEPDELIMLLDECIATPNGGFALNNDVLNVPELLLAARHRFALLSGKICHGAQDPDSVLPITLHDARRDLNQRVTLLRDKWLAQSAQRHTKHWEPTTRFTKKLETWLQKRDLMRSDLSALRDAWVLSMADCGFEDYTIQLQQFVEKMPSIKKDYQGNAQAAKDQVEIKRGLLLQPFFQAYSENLQSILPAWKQNFLTKTVPKIVTELTAHLRAIVEAAMAPSFSASLPTGEAQTHAAMAKELADVVLARLSAIAPDALAQLVAEKSSKIAEELARLNAQLAALPAHFTNLKAALEHKDFRRKIRKLEAKIGDVRVECVDTLLRALMDTSIDAAGLSLARAFVAESKANEAEDRAQQSDNFALQLATLQQSFATLSRDFARHLVVGREVLLMGVSASACDRLVAAAHAASFKSLPVMSVILSEEAAAAKKNKKRRANKAALKGATMAAAPAQPKTESAGASAPEPLLTTTPADLGVTGTSSVLPTADTIVPRSPGSPAPNAAAETTLDVQSKSPELAAHTESGVAAPSSLIDASLELTSQLQVALAKISELQRGQLLLQDENQLLRLEVLRLRQMLVGVGPNLFPVGPPNSVLPTLPSAPSLLLPPFSPASNALMTEPRHESRGPPPGFGPRIEKPLTSPTSSFAHAAPHHPQSQLGKRAATAAAAASTSHRQAPRTRFFCARCGLQGHSSSECTNAPMAAP